MKTVRTHLRQLVDWRAAFWAGLVSGAVSFVLSLILSAYLVKSPWFFTRLVATLAFGSRILTPFATFDLGIFFTALVIYLVLSVVLASIIAIIVHKYGILFSVLGGALIGLAFYGITFYSLSFYLPWIYPFRSWMFMVEFIVFGSLAGGLYELMEVEVFVPERSHQL